MSAHIFTKARGTKWAIIKTHGTPEVQRAQALGVCVGHAFILLKISRLAQFVPFSFLKGVNGLCGGLGPNCRSRELQTKMDGPSIKVPILVQEGIAVHKRERRDDHINCFSGRDAERA